MDELETSFKDLYKAFRYLNFCLMAVLGLCLGRGVNAAVAQAWDSVVWSGVIAVPVGLALWAVRYLRLSVDAKVLEVGTQLHVKVMAKAVADGIIAKMIDDGVTVLRCDNVDDD